MTLCYYITGHGYGHAVRSAQVIRALPADLPVILRTTIPRRFFEEELPGRAFTYAPAEFDCGCLQSDSVTVLPRATLDRYAAIAARNEAGLAAEVAFLRDHGVHVAVTDVPSFPLSAAREAGIPGAAVANFTWYDIYRDYVETDSDEQLLAQIAGEYAQASTAFVTPLSTPSVADPFPKVTPVPLVARQGTSIRPAIEQRAGSGRRIALLYLGPWGVDMDWAALATIGDWLFLAYDAPAAAPPNVVRVDRREWPFANTAASVDAVVSKAGYGTVTECIANDVPLIYVPRAEFAEYDALVAGMASWGGGVQISDADFRAGRWEPALAAAFVTGRNRDAYGIDGAAVIALALTAWL